MPGGAHAVAVNYAGWNAPPSTSKFITAGSPMEPMELYRQLFGGEPLDPNEPHQRAAELPPLSAYEEARPPSAFMRICLQEAVVSWSTDGTTARILPPFLLRRDELGLGLNDYNRVVTVKPYSWAASVGVAIGDRFVQCDDQPLNTGRKLTRVMAVARERDKHEVHLVVTRERPDASPDDVPAEGEVTQEAAVSQSHRGHQLGPATAPAPLEHREVLTELLGARQLQKQAHAHVEEQRRRRQQRRAEEEHAAHQLGWPGKRGASASRTPMRQPPRVHRLDQQDAPAPPEAAVAKPSPPKLSAADVVPAPPLRMRGCAHSAAVNALAWVGGPGSSAALLLASAGGDGGLLLWGGAGTRTADAAPRLSLAGALQETRGHSHLQALCVLGGGALAAAGSDGLVELWDVGAEQKRGELEAHHGCVWALAAPPRGAMLAGAATGVPIVASGGADRTVRLWDARQRHEVASLAGHLASVLSLAWVEPWDGSATPPVSAPAEPVFVPSSLAELDAMDVAPPPPPKRLDERLLASADAKGAVRVWDLRAMRCQGACRAGGGATHALHAARGLLFGAHAAGGVDGFDARRGFQEHAGLVCDHGEPAWALASDGESCLFSAAANGPLLRHALPSLQPLPPLESHQHGTSALEAVRLAEGRLLLASGGFEDGEVWVHEVADNPREQSAPTGGSSDLAVDT